MMFHRHCCCIFGLVNDILVFSKMLFLSGSLLIVHRERILGILLMHAMLLFLGFVKPNSLLVSLRVPCFQIRANY